MIYYSGFVNTKVIPQGSISPMPFRRKNGKLGVSVFQKPELLNFREKVAEDVKTRYGLTEIPFPKGTPVMVNLTFKLLKAKSNKHLLPVTKGVDLDKAVRSCLDAWSGILYDDDSQVVFITASKVFVSSEEEIGVGYMVNEYTYTA